MAIYWYNYIIYINTRNQAGAIMDNWAGLILAAGKGSRMKSNTPKVLHKILGQSLIQFPITALRETGITDINLVVSPDNKKPISATLDDSIKYTLQKEQKGTGDALVSYLQQCETVPKNLIIQNGDMPLISQGSIKDLIQTHSSEDNFITIVTLQDCTAGDFGRVIRNKEGLVTKIEEANESTIQSDQQTEVNAGIYCVNTKNVSEFTSELGSNHNGEQYITSLVELAYSKGLKVGFSKLKHRDEMLGVNDRLQLSQATAVMQKQIVEQLMLSGVTIINPNNVYIEPTVSIQQDATILQNSTLKGATKIGANAIIGPNTTIVNGNIGDNSVVESSTIKDSSIGIQCHVGPYSHLRENTEVKNNVHIGNNVELKNTVLESEIKAGHFCYLGDATIGKGTNIGAGTITCNYDGVNKHRTIIGENTFIGCDTMLVAPLIIGSNCLTGAGAVVTKDVPSGRRAIGVPAKITPNKDWKG